MELGVDSQGSKVDFREPVMILIAWRSRISIFGVCRLQPQIEAQYSVTL